MQTETILETLPRVLSPKAILDILKQHRVPVRAWGTKNHRSFADMVRYMTEDRVFFRNGDSPCATIDVHAVVVIVTHRFRRRWLELYEDRQIFPDGSVLRRKLFNGIAETLKRSETPRAGAARCLAEELGFRDQTAYELSECLRVENREPVPSEKWPGIMAAYHRYIFECVISRRLYQPSGYSEREGDLTISFKWKPRGQTQFRF